MPHIGAAHAVEGVSTAEEKTGILHGFKDFVTRGNVIDLAVAVVVGAAFTGVKASNDGGQPGACCRRGRPLRGAGTSTSVATILHGQTSETTFVDIP